MRKKQIAYYDSLKGNNIQCVTVLRSVFFALFSYLSMSVLRSLKSVGGKSLIFHA